MSKPRFIVIPSRLKFIRDDTRHPKALADTLSDRSARSLLGNIKAAIDDSHDMALARVTADLCEYVNRFIIRDNPSLLLSDFTLVYSAADVEDDRFWAGTGAHSEVRL